MKKELFNIKFIVIAILIIFCFISIFCVGIKQINAKKLDAIECNNYKNYILATMNPYIYDALKNHFGYQKNFDLFQIEILDIIDGTYQGYYFDIILSVTSYQGAHLYDFSINEIRFRLDDKGINLIDFQ